MKYGEAFVDDGVQRWRRGVIPRKNTKSTHARTYGKQFCFPFVCFDLALPLFNQSGKSGCIERHAHHGTFCRGCCLEAMTPEIVVPRRGDRLPEEEGAGKKCSAGRAAAKFVGRAVPLCLFSSECGCSRSFMEIAWTSNPDMGVRAQQARLLENGDL